MRFCAAEAIYGVINNDKICPGAHHCDRTQQLLSAAGLLHCESKNGHPTHVDNFAKN